MYNGCIFDVMNNNKTAQLSIMGDYEIVLGERPIAYTLKRSTKARLIWLYVKPQVGLIVTIPPTYDIKNLPEYLQINSKWILRNLDRYCPENVIPLPDAPHKANTISYLGQCLKVTRPKNYVGVPLVKLDHNKLVISLCRADKNLSAMELKHWLKEQAVTLINAKVKQFANLIGVLFNRITIRDQKSRWGSCSCRKNLNFNWRLIMAPEPVLDYVVIHELCHLKDMSHSRSFWKLVARYCPQWHDYRDWLDNHCAELNAAV
jgi:predicted metal-dependent hydrolase